MERLKRFNFTTIKSGNINDFNGMLLAFDKRKQKLAFLNWNTQPITDFRHQVMILANNLEFREIKYKLTDLFRKSIAIS